MLEWLKRHAWKACIPQKGISGSNPDLSAHFFNTTVMKKVLFTLMIAAGVFTLASCSKNCNCSASYNGEVVFEETLEMEDGDKCSDFNRKVSIPAINVSVETKCTPQLF